MPDFTSQLASLIKSNTGPASLADAAVQLRAAQADLSAVDLARALKAGLASADLRTSGFSAKSVVDPAPDPLAGPIAVARSLVAARFGVNDVAAALVAQGVYPNLTAVQLGTVLLTTGVFPGLPRTQMQTALESAKIYPAAVIASALDTLYPVPVTTLTHHWAFAETSGAVALDSAGTVNGTLTPTVTRTAQGPGGQRAVHLDGSNDSYVTFGTGVGQFGTANFTACLWIQTTETYRYFDLVGNRTDGSHGIFFCLRMTGRHESWPQGAINLEVDENGQNYIFVQGSQAGLNNGAWHHVAAVREGATVRLYIDGQPAGSGNAGAPANIANGNPFKLGRSLVGVSDKFAPNAQFADLRLYDGALTGPQVAGIYAEGSGLQHRWLFAEASRPTALDSAGSVNGTLTATAIRQAGGPLGLKAVHLDGSNDSYVTFGTGVGQFGTANFTTCLWIQTTETYRYFDLVGNRTDGSHGIFFCLRMTGRHESWPQGAVNLEVDQNGQNYISVQSSRAGLNDGAWHHVAAVREGATVRLYIDGQPSGSGSAAAPANIANANPFKLGRSLVGVSDKFAPNAQFADLRVYGAALSPAQIAAIAAGRS